MGLVRRLGGGTWTLVAGMGILALGDLAACARGVETDGDLFDGEGGVEDAQTRDGTTTVPPADAGTARETGTNPGNDAGCAPEIVINELQSNGASASDEFVELYNNGTCAIPLNGWKLSYRSSNNGASAAPLYTFGAADTIKSKGYFLVASSNLPNKDANLNSGMAAAAGQVGLLDNTNKLRDGVAYGTIPGAADFREGTAAPAPPNGGSIARKTDGVDTDNNAADFKTSNPATPGAAN